MSKSFAQIETSLPHSKKIRQLSHEERWAYLCAHLTPLGGYMGLFRYSTAVWADDADLPRSSLVGAIEKMISVGLIEYSAEDEHVRIQNWFMKKNAPENASRMASLAANYATIDAPDHLLLKSVAEFTVGSVKRAQRWKPDSSEWGKLRDVFKPFLANMRQNYEDDFHSALNDQLEGQNRAVKSEVCALMPSLQFFIEAPCPHRAHTVAAHDIEMRLDTDKMKKEIETKTNMSRASAKYEQTQPKAQDVQSVDAERWGKAQGPRSETIASAKQMGLIR